MIDNKTLKQFKYKGEPIQIGFVLNNLTAGQIPFTCIDAINDILVETAYINMCLFVLDNRVPCLAPSCALYNVIDSSVFPGHLIATSIETLRSISNNARAKKYFYVQDLTWINDQSNIELVNRKDIVKFTRSYDYTNRLISDGFNVSSTIVDDFNIHKILKVINENS